MKIPMQKYVIDSNLYIRAWRNPTDRDDLRSFIVSAGPGVHLHSTVAAELLAGSRTPELRRITEDMFIKPFERVERVITPEHSTWKRAGGILARLIKSKRMEETGATKSFFNDCLIAASAREHGLAVVTDNRKDFELIGTVERIQVLAPWPGQLKLM
jgi:predicted nucleic acid-binding protein